MGSGKQGERVPVSCQELDTQGHLNRGKGQAEGRGDILQPVPNFEAQSGVEAQSRVHLDLPGQDSTPISPPAHCAGSIRSSKSGLSRVPTLHLQDSLYTTQTLGF